MNERWPNFFVVGAPRAGTTSMWHYLRGHPEIFMSPLKEPHFFGDFKPTLILEYVSEPHEYLRLFEGATDEPVLGEATPAYLSSQVAPARIHAVSPQARILAILRDPIERAQSDFWHKVRYGEQRSFLDVVRAGLEGESFLIRSGRYADALQRYRELFGENVLVLVFEELIADVRAGVRQVLEFLEVDTVYADHFDPTPRNTSSLPRNAILRRLYRSPRLRALGHKVLPRALHAPIEEAMLRCSGSAVMEAEARNLLSDAYRDDVARVEQMLGRELPWDV